jgi:hypothetical protein
LKNHQWATPHFYEFKSQSASREAPWRWFGNCHTGHVTRRDMINAEPMLAGFECAVADFFAT